VSFLDKNERYYLRTIFYFFYLNVHDIPKGINALKYVMDIIYTRYFLSIWSPIFPVYILDTAMWLELVHRTSTDTSQWIYMNTATAYRVDLAEPVSGLI